MEKERTKKYKKSNIVTAVLFIFSLVVVAVIAFREFGGEQDRHIEQGSFNVLYLFAAIGCYLLALLCESTKYCYLLRGKGIANRRNVGFSTAVIGKYYDNLTPAGAGGQGFQMYYLSSHGCDSGTAGGLPIIGFLGLHIVFVLIGVTTLILGRNFLGEDLVAIKVTASVGIVFYAMVPCCIIFFLIAPRVLESIVGWGTRMLGKLHVIKKPEEAAEKAIDSLKSYTSTLRSFSHSKIKMLVVFGLSFIYQMCFMSLPFFVLRFFGASTGFIECFCRVVYIYCAITIIFTPGNSGAAEASFYMVFNHLSGGEVFWGMLVWRALCFYSWIFLGALVQVRDRLTAKKDQAFSESKSDQLPSEDENSRATQENKKDQSEEIQQKSG